MLKKYRVLPAPPGAATGWIVGGKVAASGSEVELTEEQAQKAAKRGSISLEQQATAPAAQTDAPQTTPAAPVAQPEPPFEVQLAKSLGHGPYAKATAKKIIAAGFDSAEMIQAATDEDLLDIEGVGEATVDKLRTAFPPPSPILPAEEEE